MSPSPADERTGRYTGRGSWWPVSSFRRPRSLRTRLVVGVLGLVLVMAAVMSTFSTLSLRHTLTVRTDSQLMAAAQRAADKRHDVEQEARKASDQAAQSSQTDQGSQAGGAQPPDGADGAAPDKQGVPPGLDAAGQSTGTLTLIAPATSTSGSEAAAYIDKDGRYAAISKEDCRLLLSEATGDHPVTVHLHHLGSYRVVATRDQVSGDTVITGLSLEADKALIGTQLLIELVVALVGALIVALAGRTMVRSSLAPLERVARTAHRVASQPLERGEVTIEDRVEEADLTSSAEVGHVGGALNTLLGHVESALGARQRSETQVRQFVADASHELRTPLASIRGYTELIRREGADADLPEEATYALDRVHSESVRMTALVEDLLLLARLDAGRELRHEEVDLVGLLVDTVADARAAGPDHDWRLDLAVLEPPADVTPEEAEEFLPEPPLVIGDEARLRQVIVNLLANARVHTPAGSHVTTTLEREGESLIVRIGDDGPGIAPDVRDRLFERFARGDSSRERRTGSTGLGMSIALAIVQSHGGSIDVESSTAPQDHGTTFIVRLPAAAVEE
ncbi:HAMP domain-containing sensor histidine kinase [Actinomyces sp. ZJ308]|uniref:sensor histidine kinase n=1 Tax=Actinomyces sp. ZJ308 TaxID=2708342 RepID=UPI00141F18C2|nr:HAMP domain-containing sensor histidine kinase [Actinomyces sp. ZJ308]